MQILSLSILPETIAICRLPHDAPIPAWAMPDASTLYSITRTTDELSIVCNQELVPPATPMVERNWRAIKVGGPLDFSLTGILASLANPLAEAEISIFAISTFDTDYVLVQDDNFEQAIQILSTFCTIH
jgi:hypothetical protein